MATSPELDFVRYRDHGDLPALAAVFDAVAAHLLLVAGHLVRDGALAEDLVQTTFVEAMRSAHRYDAQRPLLPWLVRILTHHASKLRRQRYRPADPRSSDRSAHRSAAEHVLAEEVVTAVERALAELPVHYRQVLTLRLVHDLSPTAIAHAIGCPPNTVKTRLKRGLDLLRRHLPTGIATTVALMLATERGLAAVRGDVLLQAGHTALRGAKAAASRVLPFGVLLMNQFLLRAVIVALVLVLGWLGVDAWSSRPDHPSATSHAAPVVAALDAVPAADAAALRSEATPMPAAGAAKVVFHGRCLDASTGKPLAGVTAATWWIDKPTVKVLNEYELTDALDHTVTDGEGRFRLACELTQGLAISLRVWSEDLLGRITAFGPFPGPQEVDCGDLPMRAGVRVSTRVVDRRGQPVGGVVFTATLRSFRASGDEPLAERAGFGVRSAADGTVAWPCALVPGRYQVWWYEDAIPPERSHGEMVIPADTASLQNEVLWPVEDERQAIRGTVVDEIGQPVGGLYLGGEGAGTRGNSRSAWDGRFVMPRIGPYDESLLGPVTLTILNVIDGFEFVNTSTCQWGSRDLRLVVRTAQTLVVRAIDPRTRKPLPDCTIVCAARLPENDGVPWAVVPRTTARADGAMQLGIARVPHSLQVLPKDPALAPSALLHWEPGTTDELTVELTPTKTIEVLVVDVQGKPIRGSEVWTAQPIEGGAAGRDTAMQDAPMPLAFAFGLDPATRWKRYGIDDAPLDHGTTDATGRVRLRVPTTMPALVAAFGPGHVPRAIVTATAGERIELPVQRGAAVRFELSPPDLVPHFVPSARDRQVVANREAGGARQGPTLSATRSMHEQDPEHWQPTVSSAVTGKACICDGLVPGSYDLRLYGVLRRDLGDIVLMQALETVTLQEGEERVVPLDLRRWAPGRVRGQVRVNGKPWASDVGFLLSLQTSVPVHTDAEGCFEVEMVPGECQLHLRDRFDHSTFWVASERYTVASNTTIEATFDVRRVAARVRLVTAADQPVANQHVGIVCAGEPGDSRSWTTDADGCFTIDPAPLGSFQLVVAPADRGITPPDGSTDATRQVTLDPLQVPSTGTSTAFLLRLPEGWR